MAINFPNNPTLNQEFTEGEKLWRWNGFRWRAVPASLINVRQQLATVEQSKAETNTYTTTIAALDTWTDTNGIFTLTKNIAGILETDNPIADLNLSSILDPITNVELIQTAWGTIYRIVTSNGSITFYATEQPVFPVDTDVQFKVVR